MKKTNNARGRSFRRWVRNLFNSILKRQDHSEEVLNRLQSIEDSIEIVAREIARQAKRSK